jgi:hypothetical protein
MFSSTRAATRTPRARAVPPFVVRSAAESDSERTCVRAAESPRVPTHHGLPELLTSPSSCVENVAG